MTYYIAFDVAHKPRGKIDENYSELRDLLNSNDLICYNFLETPITYESLKPYDILVFVCPDFAKITHQEMTAIEQWVKEDGGGLLLLSHAGGDRGRNSNLSELAEQFGMYFENDQVLDEENNIGMENMPLTSTFNPPHPITDGITSLCYRAGCSLGINGNAFSIANSNESSDPFSCPLICVSETENGRVCAIGSYEMFRDRIGGGMQNDNHQEFALNVFNWLVSDYRAELRSGSATAEPVATPSGANTASGGAAAEDGRSVDIDFSIKISTKSELMELLKIFQNQIITIKDTIDNLINKASASEDEIIALKKAEVAPPTFEIPGIDTTEQADGQTSFEAGDPDYKELHELKPVPLSALPPKPPGLLKKAPEAKPLSDEDFIGLPPIEGAPKESTEETEAASETEVEKVKKTKKKPEPKKKKEEKIDKKELEAEKEGLESKLNSIHNLVSFIEKKHTSGKMDDKSYKKQIARAKKDIDKTIKRITEINELLEKN